MLQAQVRAHSRLPGELREQSCLRASGSLMLFMVMNSRGFSEEEEEEEERGGRGVKKDRKLEGHEKRQSVQSTKDGR